MRAAIRIINNDEAGLMLEILADGPPRQLLGSIRLTVDRADELAAELKQATQVIADQRSA